MASLNDASNLMASDDTLAQYRGVTVVVHKVDKTEVNLTRNDLIELVNVSHSLHPSPPTNTVFNRHFCYETKRKHFVR